jgi:hypothetical protein
VKLVDPGEIGGVDDLGIAARRTYRGEHVPC